MNKRIIFDRQDGLAFQCWFDYYIIACLEPEDAAQVIIKHVKSLFSKGLEGEVTE